MIAEFVTHTPPPPFSSRSVPLDRICLRILSWGLLFASQYFPLTEYVPPIMQGQIVSPSHVVALSHVPGTISIPCHGTISNSCHGTISIPCDGTISIPCHGTISTPCHGTISIPCHGTISTPCHGTISIPCHVSLTLSDDVVLYGFFMWVVSCTSHCKIRSGRGV